MRESINDVVAAYTARHAMEPVEAETHAHLIAQRILEGMDEPVCEWDHQSTTCTRSVTHRAADCVEQRNICQGGRVSIDQTLAEHPDCVCAECGGLAIACWKMWAV